MGSLNRGRNPLSGGGAHPAFTRVHQIGALSLIAVTFILTRAFDRLSSCPISSPSASYSDITTAPSTTTSSSISFGPSGVLNWPQRGFGARLDLKIYVCDEGEIEGLRELMRGRDGKISADACVKGQWGTQVKIHQLLLKSKYRTSNKKEADLFFVPSYVKCVRMLEGLNDKEINQTYVKVLSQMPYFRLSGGRDHVFVFPSGAGAHLFRSWSNFLNRSIILTPEYRGIEQTNEIQGL